MDRPELLPEPVPYYDFDFSVHPDSLRVSFNDGSTAIYDIRRNMPHPLVLKNAEIMKETKQNIRQGYVNKPQRRKWRNRT